MAAATIFQTFRLRFIVTPYHALWITPPSCPRLDPKPGRGLQKLFECWVP